MTETRRVLIELTIAAPVEAVWQALRDPDRIRRWFGWDYAGLAAEIHAMFVAGGSAAPDSRSLRVDGNDVFELEPQGERTVVRLIRCAPVEHDDWQGIYDDIDEGWLTFLHQLRYALERHPDEDRRTLFLSGHAPAAGAPLPPAALELADLEQAPRGRRFTRRLPTGDAVDGEVWFRSPHQLGLALDGFGRGLLIASRRPGRGKSPHGGGAVLLTTYGLDDDAFRTLRDCRRTLVAHNANPQMVAERGRPANDRSLSDAVRRVHHVIVDRDDPRDLDHGSSSGVGDDRRDVDALRTRIDNAADEIRPLAGSSKVVGTRCAQGFEVLERGETCLDGRRETQAEGIQGGHARQVGKVTDKNCRPRRNVDNGLAWWVGYASGTQDGG